MLIQRSRFFYPCVLSAVAILVFGNTLLNGFVWDDVAFTVGKSVYKNFDLERMLFSCGNGIEYRPLRDISRAIDYALWGESPAGHHAGNLFFYVGNLLVLYFMTLQVSRFHDRVQRLDETVHRNIAFFATLLFAVHPLRSEVVAFLTNRNSLLAGLFVFGCCRAFLLHLKAQGTWRFLIISLLCFLAALLSYQTVITLPLVLLYFALMDGSVRRRRNLFSLVPFLVLSGAFFLIYKRVALISGAISGERFAASGIPAKIAKAVEICFFYLNKFLLPVGLSPEYDTVFAASLAKPLVIAELLVLAAVIGVSVRYREKYPEALFAVVWYLVLLIPVSNFFATNPAVADRYAYLPSFSLFFLLSSLLFRTVSVNRLKYAVVFSLLLAACWATAAFQQNTIWRDERRLWEETVKRSPGLVKAYENLGLTYLNERNYSRAMEYFSQMKNKSLYGAANYDYYQGVVYEENGDFPNAALAYKSALAKDENLLLPRFHLAGVNFMQGEFEDALENYGKVIFSSEVDSGGVKTKALEQQEKIRKMVFPQLDLLRKRANADQAKIEDLASLAIQLDRLGYYDEALGHYLKVAEQGTSNWQLFFNIANIYKKMNKFKEAAGYYEKSLEINPSYADTLNNLGVVYKEMKLYPQAVAMFEKAIKEDSNFSFAPYNLATTYYLMGEKDKALTYFTYTREHFPELETRVKSYLTLLK